MSTTPYNKNHSRRHSCSLATAPWPINALLSAGFASASYFHTELGLLAVQLAGRFVRLSTLEFSTLKVLAQSASWFVLWGGACLSVIAGTHALMGIFRSRAHKRHRILLLRKAQDREALGQMGWRDFELLVGQLFKKQGYRIAEGAGSQDGGIDITLTDSEGKILLVQCKHWKSSKVGVAVVRELAGVVQLNQAHSGIVVCSGRYTREARAEAEQLGISLVTGDELLAHIAATR